MLIFLTGYMGSGKSTAGKRLANRMKFDFLDLDKSIEKKYGSIPEIFEKQGETAFREMEKECLHETANLVNAVIATGGGTPCFFDNQLWMNTRGITVYLKMSPLSLVNRLKQAKSSRPLLKGRLNENMLAFVSESLNEREAFYNQANMIIKAESLDIEGLVQKILEFKK